MTASPPASLLPRAATSEQLEAIRLGCVEKDLDLGLILQGHNVSQLEELDHDRAAVVLNWIEGQ